MRDTEKPNKIVCIHGHMAKSCESCEKDRNIALLKQQVELLANELRFVPPESYAHSFNDWPECSDSEQIQEWIKWSLEKATEMSRDEV